MSLLLDENLSWRLVARLSSLFPKLLHVRDIGFQRASDREIWDWATANRYTIVTTDGDLLILSAKRGTPPKVVYLESCDVPLRVIEELLRRNAVRIAEFEKDPGAPVLTLRFSR